MGGPGSGNRYRFSRKDTVEEHRELDVRDWHREGYLDGEPTSITVSWSCSGKQIAAIGVVVFRDRARLSYDTWRRSDESDRESRNYSVPITWTACNFGGERPWFICPGVVNGRVCNRRVAKLYLSAGYFLCRHCHDLTYESRQTGSKYAPLRKCQKIRQRLGGSANMSERFPPRPKGMHFDTYLRLLHEHDRADQQYTASLITDLEKMNIFLSSIGKGKK